MKTTKLLCTICNVEFWYNARPIQWQKSAAYGRSQVNERASSWCACTMWTRQPLRARERASESKWCGSHTYQVKSSISRFIAWTTEAHNRTEWLLFSSHRLCLALSLYVCACMCELCTCLSEPRVLSVPCPKQEFRFQHWARNWTRSSQHNIHDDKSVWPIERSVGKSCFSFRSPLSLARARTHTHAVGLTNICVIHNWLVRVSPPSDIRK